MTEKPHVSFNTLVNPAGVSEEYLEEAVLLYIISTDPRLTLEQQKTLADFSISDQAVIALYKEMVGLSPKTPKIDDTPSANS